MVDPVQTVEEGKELCVSLRGRCLVLLPRGGISMLRRGRRLPNAPHPCQAARVLKSDDTPRLFRLFNPHFHGQQKTILHCALSDLKTSQSSPYTCAEPLYSHLALSQLFSVPTQHPSHSETRGRCLYLVIFHSFGFNPANNLQTPEQSLKSVFIPDPSRVPSLPSFVKPACAST